MTKLNNLFIALLTVFTFSVTIAPAQVKAFNMDELTTLINELSTETEGVIATATNVEPDEELSFRDKMKKNNEEILEVAESINSKKPQIEGIANDINVDTVDYVNGLADKKTVTDKLSEMFKGINFETMKNAVESIKNGEEIQADSEYGSYVLQVIGAQSTTNPFGEASVKIVRSLLGLMLVASLFGLAKHQINKGYRSY